jgi:hypothetical protein
MNKILKILLPLLCLQWGFVNGENVEHNVYSNEHFKQQLDGSFKKYFNDNIYKIREYSRERRFFHKRFVTRQEEENTGEVQDLSCGSTFIQSLKNCNPDVNDKFSCVKSLTSSQFNAYISCTSDNSDTPNYGELINSIVLGSLRTSVASSFNTINDAINDVYQKIKFVANKNSSPYRTGKFLEELEGFYFKSEDKIISSNYLNCLKLVEQEIYPQYEDVSVCLCSYSYDKDNKLYALYSYYGFSEESFNSVCTPLLEKSEIYNNENKYISNLNHENLLILLKEYNIPNYGELFNSMMIKKLETATVSIKKVVYDLYTNINNVVREKYSTSTKNAETVELGRCLVQAVNRVIDNSGYSYCLCNAGYDVFEELSAVYNEYGLNSISYNEICSSIKEERNQLPYCRLGKTVETCLDRIDMNMFSNHDNHTECLDIGPVDSFKMQTKCLCDLYKATWVNGEFLSCYGYTELSFILDCRQFYPNQMFSDNPARGIENFYSENYDDICGDSGTGGGNIIHDPCICKARKESGEVSLELDDICSRVGVNPPETCSNAFLTFKFSGLLLKT